MSLNTATKITFGRGLYWTVRAARSLAGKGRTAVCRRQGLRWSLDLSEGIDLSLFLFGAFDRAAALTLRRSLRPGMVAFDIGANIGAHALPMANMVGPKGRVYAFEPTRWAYERLLANRILNPDVAPSLVPFQAALGKAGDKLPPDFYSSWSLTPQGPVHDVHRGSLQSTEGARLTTLDGMVEELGLQRLDFIKLDVDGYETGVLAGGHATLARFGPPILFELAPHSHEEHGTSASAMLAVMSAHGYRFYDLRGAPFAEVDDEALRKHVPRWGSINLMARR